MTYNEYRETLSPQRKAEIEIESRKLDRKIARWSALRGIRDNFIKFFKSFGRIDKKIL
jgi:hypothetical protein